MNKAITRYEPVYFLIIALFFTFQVSHFSSRLLYNYLYGGSIPRFVVCIDFGKKFSSRDQCWYIHMNKEWGQTSFCS